MKSTKIILGALVLGSLTFASCKKKGCTDGDATNFSSEAKKDDGTCVYAPVITLNGAASITIAVGGTYDELGAAAVNADGSSVTVTVNNSAVNTATAGVYSVTYSASNDNGTTTATRTVNVVVDQSTYLADFTVSSDCSATTFPVSGSSTVTAGATSSDINIETFFNLVGGTATATVSGSTVTVPSQTINITVGDITFSGTGSMNDAGTEMTITYDYDNTTPFVGGTGTCTVVYTK